MIVYYGKYKNDLIYYDVSIEGYRKIKIRNIYYKAYFKDFHFQEINNTIIIPTMAYRDDFISAKYVESLVLQYLT